MSKSEDLIGADVAEIALDLVRAYGLTYEPSESLVKNMALQRWMDYRLRHIAVKPREVKKSKRFPVNDLPNGMEVALKLIEDRFISGGDVNPYLSKTTILNDVSAEAEKKRTDGLWADWKIHHLHLTDKPLDPSKRFSERSGWLLFVMVFEDVVAFIDVRSHSEKDLWTQVELFGAFVESWPEKAEIYRVKEMIIDDGARSASDLKMLRDAGVNCAVEYNGEYYHGPGLGLTGAITSTAAMMACNDIRRSANAMASWLDQEDNPIRKELLESGVADPKFGLAVGDHGLCIVVRDCSEKSWVLPEFSGGAITFFGALGNKLLPKWAIGTLMHYLRNQ